MAASQNVEIVEVLTKAQRRKFVDYPNQLYKDNPYFVPAFYGDDLDDWDPKKNPAFEYCEARCFLAYRDGQIVGRIGAILSHRANEKWGTKRMRFSQVDFIDDPAVSKALFDKVEEWAREKGCDELQGPLGFSDMDREGMLVDGFDRRSMFITYYNDPYYIEHMERMGFEKDADWIEYMLMVPQPGDPNYVKINRIAEAVLKRSNTHLVKLKKRSEYKPYIRKVFELANVAYAPLYGTVEFNDRQVERYANKFIPLINPDYCLLLEDENNELVAFGIAAPSMAEAMKACHGHLFPFGWIGVLKSLRKNDALDLLLVAVRPDLQRLGLNGILMNRMMQSALKNGIKCAETGPMLEKNAKILAQSKMFAQEPKKRRRCFVKKIV